MVKDQDRFALVNVTAKDEQVLDRKLREIFKGSLIVRPGIRSQNPESRSQEE